MPILVVNLSQTAGAAASTLAIAPTARNLLCCFVSQSATTSAPSVTGWVFNGTNATWSAGANSLFFGTRVADGTETTITVTAGSGGTSQGITMWELNGAANTVEGTPTALNAQTGTSGILTMPTSTNTGDILLMAVGQALSSGTPTSWTAGSGTNPISTSTVVATRAQGGYLIISDTQASIAYTASWGNSHAFGMLGVFIEQNTTGVLEAF